MQDGREVQGGGLPVLDREAGVEHLRLPDGLLERPEAEARQVLADD